MALAAGDAKARVEVDLTKALNSLVAVKEGGRRLEECINLHGMYFTIRVKKW